MMYPGSYLSWVLLAVRLLRPDPITCAATLSGCERQHCETDDCGLYILQTVRYSLSHADGAGRSSGDRSAVFCSACGPCLLMSWLECSAEGLSQHCLRVKGKIARKPFFFADERHELLKKDHSESFHEFMDTGVVRSSAKIVAQRWATTGCFKDG